MDLDRHYLQMALEEAEAAAGEGCLPVGAVILGPGGQVLSRGRNRVSTTRDGVAHAEIDAIRRTGLLLFEEPYRNRCTLYTSLEPCPMCTGATLASHFSRVVWATNDDDFGGFRAMRNAGLYPHRFGRMTTREAPFPDLDQRGRVLLDAWRAARGGTEPKWTAPRS